jgi:FdrA protein
VTDRLVVRRGAYYDSVTLMLASRDAEEVPGVEFAAAVTATPVNMSLLASNGFDLSSENLTSNDLVIAIRTEDDAAGDDAVLRVESRLAGEGDSAGAAAEQIPARSFRSAARRDPGVSLAFVSVPGRHAAYEVATALEAGLNVFCFSDGLSLDDEAALKKRALERGLLMLGADCGTAIIDGVALGFANVVRRGSIGVIGASGTGIQEVTCLLDSAGAGISHAIGVGGRDLNARVGGLMTVRALELLAFDDSTRSIVLISKPPDPKVAAVVAAAAARTGKPVVMGILGSSDAMKVPEGVELVMSLEEAAVRGAEAAGADVNTHDAAIPSRRTPGAIRGLFAGGSLCFEASGVVAAVGALPEDSFVDYGEDEMTEGRAHPMIDPTLRDEAFDRAAADPAVGAVIVDVVLGIGAHPDPARALAPRIEKALGERRGSLTVVAAVCGTDGDPQNASSQAGLLGDAGALVTRNAAHAARMALAATRGEA